MTAEQAGSIAGWWTARVLVFTFVYFPLACIALLLTGRWVKLPENFRKSTEEAKREGII